MAQGPGTSSKTCSLPSPPSRPSACLAPVRTSPRGCPYKCNHSFSEGGVTTVRIPPVRHSPSVERASEKWSERKSSACSQRARALPVGQELAVGPFPLETNTKSQNTHSGCHKAALLSLHVQSSGTHPVLIFPARNGASAKALRVFRSYSPPSGLSSPTWDSTRARGAITRAVGTRQPCPSPPPEGGRGRATRGQGLLGLNPRALSAGARDRGRGWALGV